MYRFIAETDFPDDDLLREADIVETAKLWKLLLRVVSVTVSELEFKDEYSGKVLTKTLNQMKSDALHAIPCVRRLVRECVSGKITEHHQELLACSVSASAKLKALSEEAAGHISANLLDLCHVRIP